MTYAWRIPYGPMAVLFVFSGTFYFKPSKNYRHWLLISGAIYVYGAIIATFSSDILHIQTDHSIWHELAASYEESLEMIGLSLFIYFFLKYIHIKIAWSSTEKANANVISVH